MLSSDTQLVAKLVNGKLSSSKVVKFEGVCTDTRDKVDGKLFIALEGNNFDGHSFIQKAEDLGAKAIIVNKNGKGAGKSGVKDSLCDTTLKWHNFCSI